MIYDPEAEAYEEGSREAELARLAEVKQEGYLKAVLATYEGRAVVFELLCEAGIYRNSFAGEHTHHTAFAEGKRKVALDFLRKCLTADERSYNLMRVEAAERSAVSGNSRGDLDA